ncbi:MAG: UDP-N-acetylmuramate dehydrogenase [Saprospiraceae bacterium]|nr:UDP-N-acetylmuramate dehydrogenase [Pyrinomonadaceae bacterium]
MNSTKTIDVRTGVSLAEFTTLNIGGPARFFVRAENESQVSEAVAFASAKELDLFVLGGGSNILVSDAGFSGLVLQIALKGVISEPAAGGARLPSEPPVSIDVRHQPSASADGSDRDNISLSVQAGEEWDEFVAYCVDHDLAGIECLSGIPGLIGGTPVQNVGAYGQEVSETIVSVRCLDRITGDLAELTNSDCGFGYRTSIFNSTMRERYIVLSVTYRLQLGGEPKIVYKDVREYLENVSAGAGSVVTLRQTRDAVLQIRRAKSMVIHRNDPNSRSAGSFFKNPIVNKEKVADISLKMNTATVPHFIVDENLVKIPAAWLMESSGYKKGYTTGNVGLSTNHTLAIINRGNASALELVGFMTEIQSKVETDFGIDLKPEPVFVGFD